VIFDDLGVERGTDYALEKVYDIIDSRYRRRLPMLLTTNRSVEEMKQEVDRRYTRIYDRIFEVCYPMQFVGQSWRKKEASQRFREMEKLLGGD
jgi:DNA replication protein DnaC